MKARVGDKLMFLLILLLMAVFAQTALALSLGDATITLQSHRYYKRWDLTRFVYRVKSPARNIPESWILSTDGCISDDQVDQWSSTSFAWVEEPFPGLGFGVSSKNQKVYLWLNGQWDVGAVDTAVVFESESGEPEIFQGSIDGPMCEESSISLDVTGGAEVEFAPLLQAGSYPATDVTHLSVSSSSSDWSLDHSLTFSIPEGAQRSIVERLFQVSVAPHSTAAGNTDVDVSYQLNVEDSDFAGLPEGTYVISITFTVTADD